MANKFRPEGNVQSICSCFLRYVFPSFAISVALNINKFFEYKAVDHWYRFCFSKIAMQLLLI